MWYCVVLGEWISRIDSCVWRKSFGSSCSITILTCVGSLVILLVIGSRIDKRFVGAESCRCFLSFEAVF